MTRNGTKRTRMMLFLFALILTAQLFAVPARAADLELLHNLPGEWFAAGLEVEREGETPWLADLFLTLEESGDMELVIYNDSGDCVNTFSGTWSSEYYSEEMDRLLLEFDYAEDPFVYNIYSEAGVENNVHRTWLILEETEHEEQTPFERYFEFDGMSFCREKGPDMRVVNCDSWVSLREEPSTSARRITKVPLGALVFTYGQIDDFTYCVYENEDQAGFILTRYLEPIE